MAIPRTLEDPAWFADTGANNHETADKGNLNVVKKYEGKEKLLVGDGNPLQISHIGKMNIPILNDKSLALNYLLHVPAIQKNLISVS